MNIIRKASEAMQDIPAEKRRVVLKSKLTAGTVWVTVRDFGTGLPVDNPERIFEHFFSTKAGGMGVAHHCTFDYRLARRVIGHV